MPLTLTILSAAVPRGAARPCARRVGRHQRPRRRARPARRRRRRLRHLVALDLLAQRADRPRARSARAQPPEGDVRAGRHGSTCRASVLASAGLFGIVWGLVRGNSVGWGSPEIVGALVGGAAMHRRVRLVGAPHAGADAADALLPQPDVRARERLVASSCSSGCSARSSCSRSSSRRCRATRRCSPGLRILPWTAMPIFVAPIAGALSDRIGGQQLMGLGLALQAIGLAWIAHVSTPTTPYSSTRRSRSRSRVRAWRCSSRRSRTSSSRRSSRRRRARPRAPTTRSASSAASSASRCSPRSSPTTAATRAAQAFVDGMTPAVCVGAAVVGLGSLAAFGIKRRRGRRRSRRRRWTDANGRVPGTVPGTWAAL